MWPSAQLSRHCLNTPDTNTGTLSAPHAAAEAPMNQPDTTPTKAMIGTDTIKTATRKKSKL